MNQVFRTFFTIGICMSLLLSGCSVGNKIEASESIGVTPKSFSEITQNQPSGDHSPFSNLRPSLSENIVVYFNPHADDEVLTFGVPILNDLFQNKKVYVVLLSPGEDSIARDLVNGKYDKESYYPYMAGKPLWCNFHKRYHNPAHEGFKALTQKQFGRERIREFFRSTTALGVPKEQLFYHRLPNGRFKYKEVKSILQDWISLFPNATFKTMSKKDIHIDHAIFGKALHELKKQKRVPYTAHYLSIATRMERGSKGLRTIPLANKQDVKKLQKAIDVYRRWDPAHHYFALGYHSVPTQFQFLQKKKTSVQSPK